MSQASSSEHINITVEGRVQVVTINRPDKKNALTHAMYAAMADALARADAENSIRVTLFTGAGDMFSAGNDLFDFMQPPPGDVPPVVRFLHNIRDAKKPIVTAVNGPAIGVGLTMLLHSDLSFASDTATFKAPFTQLGLVPEAASSMLLPLAVGTAWANDILLAGRTLTAQEALTAGLISRIFSLADLMKESMRIAGEIASMAPNSVQLSKKHIRTGRELVAERMAAEMQDFDAQLKSNEFTESVQAFLQKRAPIFD